MKTSSGGRRIRPIFRNKRMNEKRRLTDFLSLASVTIQGKITSQGEAQVSADLNQFCLYSREALKEVYETSSSCPSSSMERKSDMRVSAKGAHSQGDEVDQEKREKSPSETRQDENVR